MTRNANSLMQAIGGKILEPRLDRATVIWCHMNRQRQTRRDWLQQAAVLSVAGTMAGQGFAAEEKRTDHL